MQLTYLFSSPTGDVTLTQEELRQPFLLAPEKPHPALTLGQYFSCIERFILANDGEFLASILRAHFQTWRPTTDFKKISIRSEKHGALYHIATVEVGTAAQTATLAVTAAVNGNSEDSLKNEYARLQCLNRAWDLPYLPAVYGFGTEKWQTSSGAGTISFMVGQWLTGYHEWHLALDTGDGRQKICLWDTDSGHRFLSTSEAVEIIRQCAKILTLYYDAATFHHIGPWHHGAGDFIVRTAGNGIQVKLISVRGYETLPGFAADQTSETEIPLLVFFLITLLRLRLDRLNGVDELAWFDEFAVHAAISGFREGLTEQEAVGRLQKGFTAEFSALLKTFTSDDLLEIYRQIVDTDQQHDHPADLDFLQKQLPLHCRQLWQNLQQL